MTVHLKMEDPGFIDTQAEQAKVRRETESQARRERDCRRPYQNLNQQAIDASVAHAARDDSAVAAARARQELRSNTRSDGKVLKVASATAPNQTMCTLMKNGKKRCRVELNELHDADVQFISLVKRPANMIPFRIKKAS